MKRIDAEELENRIETMMGLCRSEWKQIPPERQAECAGRYHGLSDALKLLREMREPYGEWIPDKKYRFLVKCSECGASAGIASPTSRMDYCPGCGVKMRSESDWET